MLLVIEVESSGNCPLDFYRSFQTIDEARPVSLVATSGPDGKESMYRVVGWSSQGPTAAHAVLVDDSGEGVALLVYGGPEGVRLKDAASSQPWSLDDPSQWGDAVLLLDKDARIE